MTSIQTIIIQLERQRNLVTNAIGALQELDLGGGVAEIPAPKDQSTLSDTWTMLASKHAPKPSSRSGRLTPEGRRRLSESMKARWAQKRKMRQRR